MARVSKKPVPTAQEEKLLIERSHGKSNEALRARIVLEAAKGTQNKEIAAKEGTSEKLISKWVTRFCENGLAGLEEKVGRGRKNALDDDEYIALVQRVMSHEGNWTARSLREHLIAKHNTDVSISLIQKVLAAIELKKHAEKEWGKNRNSEFESRQTEIVGLHLGPQYQALVLQTLVEMYVDDNKQSAETASSTKYHGAQNLLVYLALDMGPQGPAADDDGRGFIDYMEDSLRHYSRGGLFIILNVTGEEMNPRVSQWLKKRVDSQKLEYQEARDEKTWMSMVQLILRLHTRKVVEQGLLKTKESIVAKTLEYITEYIGKGKPFGWQKHL